MSGREAQGVAGGFEPTSPATYAELRARCRCLARKVSLDESLGEDALNEKLAQLLAGDERLRQGQGYLLQAVLHLLQDWARRPRRSRSLETAAPRGEGGSDPEWSEAWLSCRVADFRGPEPTAEDDLLLQEAVRHREARAGLLRAALERVASSRFRAALKAQWKGALLRSGGGAAVHAFEARFRIDLGPVAGTAELAQLEGLPEGTVASDAHRGRTELRRHIQQLELVRTGSRCLGPA